MNCPKCNAVISDNSKFCTHCGAKIEQAKESIPETAASMTCIKCGAPLKPGAKFCAKCGTNQNAQPTQNTSKPVQASQPTAEQPAKPVAEQGQPAQIQQQKSVQQAPAQTAPVKQPAKKSKMPIVLIVLLVFIILFIAGGYFVLDKVFEVNPIAVIMDSGDEDQTETAEEVQDKSEKGEKGDPGLLDALDEQLEAAKNAYDEGSYEEAIKGCRELIEQYVTIGEENNLTEEADEKIKEAFEIMSKAAIDYCKNIENQESGSAGYEQVNNTVDPILELASTLTEKKYTIDSSEITEYSEGIVQRFKEVYIRKINEITEREQWSRDEAWTYAEQAYSIQKDGKTVLFDESDLDDPLRLRYVYCLAWISRKRCENGVADGSMTKEDAFNAMTAILEETDYNLLVLQDIITYGSAADKDISGYQEAYNAITQKLKDEQNLSIVNSGVNSGTSVDVRRFWYFNDLDGDDAYKVDINNGTTQATRDWIRNNIPSYISR